MPKPDAVLTNLPFTHYHQSPLPSCIRVEIMVLYIITDHVLNGGCHALLQNSYSKFKL